MNRTMMACCCALVAFLFASGAQAQNDGGGLTSRQEAQALLDKANADFAAGKFADALAAFQRLDHAGYATPDVLTKGGNAAYDAGRIGEAVLFYKRALAADPGHTIARKNLEAIQPTTNVLKGEEIATLLEAALAATPAALWLLLAEGAFLWLLAGLWLLGRAPTPESRSTRASQAAVAALVCAAMVGMVFLHEKSRRPAGDAVVVKDKTVTRMGPKESYLEQLQLPAGTALTIKGSPTDGWVPFMLVDGTTGYIRTESLERI